MTEIVNQNRSTASELSVKILQAREHMHVQTPIFICNLCTETTHVHMTSTYVRMCMYGMCLRVYALF